MLRSYDDDRGHRSFIAFCREAGCLDYAARRYRRRMDADPSDHRAREALKEIREQAMAGLVPVVRGAPKSYSAFTWAVAGILAALLALLVAYLMQRLGLSVLP